MAGEASRCRGIPADAARIVPPRHPSTHKELLLAHQHERVNIAVFIDFDNIEIGVKTTLGEHFDIGTILEAIKERGEVVTKIAYADWTRAGEYSRALTQHAIRLVQRNLTPGGDKNGADINLALDALEMAFTHPHINAYVIVGGDSDFLSLVEKLKQYDKKVFVVGGRAFTSVILQRNCHEFIAYENLVRKPAARGGRPVGPAAASPITQAFPIVRRALKILSDREVSPQTGLLKSTLLQLDSTFSERSFGASSFLDFAEKLSQAGLVHLKHSGRSVMVELNAGFEDGDGAAPPAPEQKGDAAAASAAEGEQPAGDRAPADVAAPLPQIGDAAAGVRAATDILVSAVSARWPMYLRNVKQILRAAGFDERRYGLGGLIDLLRACQRDGLVRLERDRRGGLRVFQGPAFPRTQSQAVPVAVVAAEPVEQVEPADGELAAAAPAPAEPLDEGEGAQGTADVLPEADADADGAVIDIEPVSVVDTTAELLGRAKPRRPRARTAATAPAPARTTRRTTTKRSTAAEGRRTTTTRTRKKSAGTGSES
jgi:uncharacterized LabA/DUF88 family protein